MAQAAPYGDVLSRALLRDLGIDRHMVGREIDADRWRSHGHQTIAMHTQGLDAAALAWRAVWEVGQRIAVIDGVSALDLAGMTGYEESSVHVSVPVSARVEPVPGVKIHRVRRIEAEILTAGVPRVRPHIATLRAAYWARTDRQAALLIALAAQQRIVSSRQLTEAARTVSGWRRRALVEDLVIDVTDGAQSLGELDFTRFCRTRGLPPPERQDVRRGPRGRIYLDASWPSFGLVVEIDGAQHRVALAVVSDNLRQNHVTLSGSVVLRVSVIGLRLETEAFMGQVAAALTAGGWRQGARVG